MGDDLDARRLRVRGLLCEFSIDLVSFVCHFDLAILLTPRTYEHGNRSYAYVRTDVHPALKHSCPQKKDPLIPSLATRVSFRVWIQ